jgi:Amino acid permease
MENNTIIGTYVANYSPHGDLRGAENSTGGASMDITELLFKKNTLDRQLMRKHLAGKFLRIHRVHNPNRVWSTGIAFSGTVGVGLFVTSGELIGISGSAGCVIAYAFAGLIVTAVMRSLAEMVSVRPVSGALMDYPSVFVDPALGFAVGCIYWSVRGRWKA